VPGILFPPLKSTVLVCTVASLQLLTVRAGLTADDTSASAPINFKDHVRPIFRRHCLKCHGDDEQQAGVNLQLYPALIQGGSSGRIVIPGRAGRSILMRAVTNANAEARMPPNSPPLPEETVAVIRQWINQGLRESATGQSLAAARDLTFTPAAGAGARPDRPAMPTQLSRVTAPAVIRPLPVLSMDVSRWAPVLAVAGHEQIRLIHSETKKELGQLAFPEGVPQVIRFSRDGSVLMVAGGRPVELGLVVLFDVRTGRRLTEIGDETDSILAADFSPDQTLVAIGGSGRAVKVYSTADGRLRYRLTRHTDWITSAAFSPDGTQLATADRAGGIHLWDTKSGGILLNFTEHKSAVHSIAWRDDGKLLASAGEDGRVIWWDVTDGFPAISRTNAHPPQRAPGSYGKVSNGVLFCRFGFDGTLVTAGRDRTVRIWDTGGNQKMSFAIPAAIPICSVFVDDGRTVVSGDSSGNIRFWKTR